MSAPPLTVPPPTDDDHEDVAWALRAASAQWRRQAVEDAVSWVRRAAETAHEVGAMDRANELAHLAVALAAPLQAVAPPPPTSAAAPPLPRGAQTSQPQIEVEEVEEEFDVDLDDEEIEMLDDDDDIEMVDEVEEVGNAEFIDEAQSVADFDDENEETGDFQSPTAAPPSYPEASQSSVSSPLPPPLASSPLPGSSPPPVSSHPPPAPSARALTPRARPSTSSGLDRLPPSMRPRPSGLDLEESEELDAEEDVEFGELDFEEEAATSRVSISSAPPAPDLGPISFGGSSEVPLENSTAAEYAQSRAPVPSVEDHEELERELGVDLNVRISNKQEAPGPPPVAVPEGREPSLGQAAPVSPSSAPPGAIASASYEQQNSPIPGRASVRPSSPPGGSDRVTSAEEEPYGLAPSAQLPPAAELTDLAPPVIEPPSHPRTAPPPAMMAEPEERPSQLPPPDSTIEAELSPSSYPRTSSIPGPPSGPAISSAPDADEVDDMFAAISRPPAPPSVTPKQDENESPAEAPLPPGQESEPAVEERNGTTIDGLDILDLEGLQDLPEDAAEKLVASARLVVLKRDEEVNDFGVALVTHGAVQMMPRVADAACCIARKGEVLFTRGTVEDSTQVRVVGAEDGSRVVLFSKEALAEATSDCPWVADELAEVADRYLGFAGAVLGALGDSLDEFFRFMVLEKCSVKAKLEGAVIATGGQPMDGMYILGAGRLEVLAEDGSVTEELAMGDFVFPETVLSASAAASTVRVGAGGALLLYANRMSAHELLATCPPFIELLAG